MRLVNGLVWIGELKASDRIGRSDFLDRFERGVNVHLANPLELLARSVALYFGGGLGPAPLGLASFRSHCQLGSR